MANRGGQPGNKNGAKGKLWSDAIRMELAQDKQRVRKLVRALLDKAEAGDVAALKELGDRIEGKANQTISGPDEGPIQVTDPNRPILTKEEWLKAHHVGTATRPAK